MPRARFDPHAQYEATRPFRLAGVGLTVGDALPASVPNLPDPEWERRRESLYRTHSIRLRTVQPDGELVIAPVETLATDTTDFTRADLAGVSVDQLSYHDLRRYLKQLGKPSIGKKPALQQRLQDALA